jgi:two-component system cell cycle sensor histidine kinase/response regulator CckA
MQHPILKLGVLISLVYWLLDSSIHYHAFSDESFELVPSDINELWMRSLICIMLVVFGWYIDYAKKTSERELRASENHFRSLVESSSDIVWRMNTEGILTYVSPSVKQVLGFEPDEFVGRNFDQQFANRESRHKALRILSQRLNGDLGSEPVVYELQYSCRDGTSITAEIRSVPIIGEDGEIVEEQGISRDITERSRLKEELEKMAKLEAIGMLAAGISDDLNSSLTSILGNISEARLTADPVERDKSLESTAEETMRIKDQTYQLLNVAKSGLPILRPNEIGDLIKQSADFTLLRSNLICDYSIQDDLTPIEIDEGQIRLVINSLIINAQEAMPGGGTIKVSAAMTELTPEHKIPLNPGRYVRVSIEDSGVGIPEEDSQRVFEPFYTTKPTGSGLGLATSLSIIQKHKGYISMVSKVDMGTRFDIYLPAFAMETLPGKDQGWRNSTVLQ